MTTPAYAAISDAPAEDRLAYAITEIARQSPESIAIVSSAGGDGRRAITYSSLAAQVVALEAALDATRPVGSQASSPITTPATNARSTTKMSGAFHDWSGSPRSSTSWPLRTANQTSTSRIAIRTIQARACIVVEERAVR